LGLSLAVLERTTQTKVRVTGKGAVEMRIVIVNLLVLVLLSGVAFAGPLATDPNAYNAWCGSTVMQSANGSLKVPVDYCVYGPGQFSYPGLGYTPTPGEFVYAYQMFVEGPTDVITFSVALDMGGSGDNEGSWEINDGDVAPDSSGLDEGIEVYWQWNSGLLTGEKSYGLAFSSLYAPTWGNGGVFNSGSGASGDVPVPSDVIPEPATLGLLLVGGIAGGWRRNRRARPA
jgi:hypothetical protein